MTRTRRLVAALALASCTALAACSSSDDPAAVGTDAEPTTTGAGTASTAASDPTDGSPSGSTTAPADEHGSGEAGEDGEDGEESNGDEATGIPAGLVPSGDGPTLAPSADRPTGALWYWTEDLAGSFGHGTEWSTGLEGPIAQLAEVPLHGLVFQREDSDQVIWLAGPDGPQELIVADENQYLWLEGAGLGPDEEPLVYYQRFEQGSIEDTRSTLRSYDLSTGEVREILVTGGWESGVQFGHLGGGRALGVWGGEGYSALMAVDLASGDLLVDTRDEACGQGEEGCRSYRAATAAGGQFYGIRPTGDDALGLFRLDPASGDDELVIALPWSEGDWEVENLFAGPGGSLTLSLRDGARQPLPAVTVDPATGEVESSPLAALVRPAHLT